MASQQSANNTEHQGKQVTRVAARGGKLDLSNQTPLQPTTVEQQLVTVDRELYDASNMIEKSRRVLRGYQPWLDALTKRCTANENARREEQLSLAEYTRAYNALYAQHEQTVNGFNDMAGKCVSLQQNLEETQKDKRILESKIHELENASRDKDTLVKTDNPKESQLDWDMMLQGITNNDQLEARIRELEASTLELENEKSELTDVLTKAASHISTAEHQISELEEMHRVAESKKPVSPGSRAYSGFSAEVQLHTPESGPATAVRKRRRAANLDS